MNNRPDDVPAAHVCFKTDNIKTLYEKLLANDAVIHSSHQRGVSNFVIYFREPHGILLEAIEGEIKL